MEKMTLHLMREVWSICFDQLPVQAGRSGVAHPVMHVWQRLGPLDAICAYHSFPYALASPVSRDVGSLSMAVYFDEVNNGIRPIAQSR